MDTGIWALIRGIIAPIFIPALFIIAVILIIYSIRKPFWGFCFLVFLIPQPNIWYKFQAYLFGKDIIDYLILLIIIGIFLSSDNRINFNKNTKFIIFLICLSYFSLFISSMNFYSSSAINITNPIFQDWKNYVQMLFLYVITLSLVRNEESSKLLTLIICFVLLFISIRCIRNFTPGDIFDWNKRIEGPFWRVGLYANQFSAFVIDYIAVLAGLYILDKNKYRKAFFLLTVSLSIYPILFAYSRGAYLATLAVMLCFGILKKRSLLIILAIIVVCWASILPPSVVDRINMTENENGELENSAGGRIDLWKDAIELFKQNPILGSGYNGYALSGIAEGVDSHSYFMKKLSEEGVIGMFFYLVLLFKSFQSGWKLYKIGKTSFQTGLGFGFIGCVISIVVTNVFGNRFSYFVLGSYFFIFWAIVDSNLLMVENNTEQSNTYSGIGNYPFISKFLS